MAPRSPKETSRIGSIVAAIFSGSRPIQFGGTFAKAYTPKTVALPGPATT
jgi:hypothetical protein